MRHKGATSTCIISSFIYHFKITAKIFYQQKYYAIHSGRGFDHRQWMTYWSCKFWLTPKWFSNMQLPQDCSETVNVLWQMLTAYSQYMLNLHILHNAGIQNDVDLTEENIDSFCDASVIISEGSASTSHTLCPGRTRKLHVYTSSTNTIELNIMKTQGGDSFPRFILEYQGWNLMLP